MINLHKDCWHTTRPEKTPRQRADKCGCIKKLGFKICCECAEYQDSLNMECDK